MREFSKIKCTIWGSRKFRRLSEANRLFYFYLHTNGRVNSCGCYSNPVGYIGVDMNWSQDQITEGYKACSDVGLIRYEEATETVYIENFFVVNAPQNPKHGVKLIYDIAEIGPLNFRKSRAAELREFVTNTGWRMEADFLTRIDGLIATGEILPITKEKEEKNGPSSRPPRRKKGSPEKELERFLERGRH